MRRKLLGILIACSLLLPTAALAESTVVLRSQQDPLPVPAEKDMKCWVWENCQLLDGVSILNVNITKNMDAAERRMSHHGDAWYVDGTVKNLGYTFMLTTLMLCQYTPDHTLIRCQYGYPTLSGNRINTEIRKDADHLRVILMEGAAAEISVRLVAMSE